jgi:GTPase SAR1 family protein
MIAYLKVYCSQVILIGDSGVGKSNILMRYIKNCFIKTNSTIGVEFALKNVTLPNQKTVKAQIWDTCINIT